MKEKEIKHYFKYLLLKNIPLEHPDYKYIEDYRDCCEQNMASLRNLIWDGKENQLNGVLKKQLDLEKYVHFLNNHVNTSYTSFQELEEVFNREKHKFLIKLIPAKSRTLSPRGKETSGSFFNKPKTVRKKEILSLFLTELQQLNKNRQDKASQHAIIEKTQQYPDIKKWYREFLFGRVNQWKKIENREEKLRAFLEINTFLKLYFLIPEAQSTEIQAMPMAAWRNAYRAFLEEEISKINEKKDKSQALRTLDENISFAIRTGAVTAFTIEEFIRIQKAYKSEMDIFLKKGEINSKQNIILHYQFIKFSITNHFLELKARIAILDDYNAMVAIYCSLYTDGTSFIEKYRLFSEIFKRFAHSFRNVSTTRKSFIYEQMGRFDNELYQLAESLFSNTHERKHQSVLDSVNYIISVDIEDDDEEESSPEASSSSHFRRD